MFVVMWRKILFFFALVLFISFSGAQLCSSNNECNDSNPQTIDFCLRPGQADAGCTNLACVPQCVTNSDCSDSDSTTIDVCAGAGRCAAACAHLVGCGNGQIDAGETPCTCPQDAGSCTGSSFGTCSEYACIGAECRETIKLGCCGNNICEFKESYSSCSVDCKPKNIEIEVIGINGESFFVRGEEALIKVKISADGVAVKNAQVKANGFFGEARLLNDGDHGDELNNDDFYANTILVPNDMQADNYVVTVSAGFDGFQGIKDFNFTVAPLLDVRIEANEEYFLGDSLNIKGIVLRKSTAIKTKALLSIYSNNIKVFEREFETNNAGEFSYSYRTSFLENAGDWRVEVFASDEFTNKGLGEKSIRVSDTKITAYLAVEVLQEIKETYNRGEALKVSVKVLRGLSEAISGAEVVAVLPDNTQTRLSETQPGIYEADIPVGLSFPLGHQEIRVNALKKNDGEKSFFAGTQSLGFNVQKVDLILEIVEPTRFSFQVGDEIEFVVRVFYPDKKPVVASEVFSKINGKDFPLKQAAKGTYTGKYLVEEKDSPFIQFEAEADDGFENNGSGEIELEVSGTSYAHYLRKYSAEIALVVVALAIAAVVTGAGVLRIGKLKEIEAKQKLLLEKIKSIQRQYFKEGAMDKKNYEVFMDKYQSELDYLQKTKEAMSKKTKKQNGF